MELTSSLKVLVKMFYDLFYIFKGADSIELDFYTTNL